MYNICTSFSTPIIPIAQPSPPSALVQLFAKLYKKHSLRYLILLYFRKTEYVRYMILDLFPRAHIGKIADMLYSSTHICL